MYAHCRRNYPAHLANLDLVDEGRTPREKVALNMFRHVLLDVELDITPSWNPEFLSLLESQLPASLKPVKARARYKSQFRSS